jgi:hypothetical protein
MSEDLNDPHRLGALIEVDDDLEEVSDSEAPQDDNDEEEAEDADNADDAEEDDADDVDDAEEGEEEDEDDETPEPTHADEKTSEPPHTDDAPAAAAAASAAAEAAAASSPKKPPKAKTGVKRPRKSADDIDMKTFSVKEFLTPSVDKLKQECKKTLDTAWGLSIRRMLAAKGRRISSRAGEIRSEIERFNEMRNRIDIEIVMD